MLYKTKAGNLINLDNVSYIFIDPEWSRKDYQVITPSGRRDYFPELTEEDIDNIIKLQQEKG